jgi:hypothetical protein
VRRLGDAAAALVVCLFAAAGEAQPQDRKVEAQALFDQAKAMTAQGNYAKACPLFALSQRIDPGLGTMLWLADCYENAGQTASAWAEFKEAAGAAALRQDPREKVAREHAAALEPKLSKLRIRAATVPGLELTRDGRAVTAAELGLELPVDPGAHSIAARARGYEPWTQTVDVPAQPGVVSVDVPALELHAVESAPVVTPAASVPHEGRSKQASMKLAGIVTGGSGLVILGVGTALSIDAKVTYDNSNAEHHCASNNVCDGTGLHDRSTAYQLAGWATAGFVVGATALAGGAAMVFLAPRIFPTSGASSAILVPSFGSHGGGLAVDGAW